ncbi:hypothetical protein [Streptosporangium oxazolinicum]|uniref:hypothetical protein n=1 Tax=Streptosporangium oxazolinicum TaxID=909287 RepID=UPI0031ECE8F4
MVPPGEGTPQPFVLVRDEVGAEAFDVSHARGQFGGGVGLDQADALPAPGGRERPPAFGGLSVPGTPAGEPGRQRDGIVCPGLVRERSGEVFRRSGGRFDGWRAHAVTPFRYASRLPGQGRTPGDSRPYGGCLYGGAAIAAGRAWRPLLAGEPAKGRLVGRAVTVVDVFGAVSAGGPADGNRPQSPRRRRAVMRARTWARVGCSHR